MKVLDNISVVREGGIQFSSNGIYRVMFTFAKRDGDLIDRTDSSGYAIELSKLDTGLLDMSEALRSLADVIDKEIDTDKRG